MSYDAVVVGAGPNGLTAAAVLARAGRRVLVIEAAPTIGGGARTDEAFGQGIKRDVCSAVHPTGFVSPAFAELDLPAAGVEWLVPPVPFAHVFGIDDALAWDASAVNAGVGQVPVDDVFNAPRIPRRPVAMARFGAAAALPVTAYTALAFRDRRKRAAFAAVAAHAARPLSAAGSTAPGLLLAGLAGTGWPVSRGGSGAITDALAGIVTGSGGAIETGQVVRDLREIPKAPNVFFDTSPRAFADILGERLPANYARRLSRFAYGPGTCKVDFRLREPIPWHGPPTRTATFHIAADLRQIADTEAAVAAGRVPPRPWVLGGEPTRIDPSRAPDGVHLAWAYCHVPAGCADDQSDAIIAEIERCAPGFRELIVDRIVTTARAYESYNQNYVGGDIGCGATSLRQLLARPVFASSPQASPLPGIYLCSAGTAPGGGVHGMSGFRAAQHALARTE